MNFDPAQLRVLGAMIEKEITTPENYPLSLNALIAACNQRSSRDPVLDLDEDAVRQALHSLEDLDLVAVVRDSRVPKYEHRVRTVLNLRRDETVVLCLLLLRGPQTPGELRNRSERMFVFDDLAAVQATLERLTSRAQDADQLGLGSLVAQLSRQPGSRESRFAHLLGGPATVFPEREPSPSQRSVDERRTEQLTTSPKDPLEARIAFLEGQLTKVMNEVRLLRDQFNH